VSSVNFTCVGPTKTLAYLRGDLRAASKSFFLIGPWLDAYVAQQIILLAPRHLHARVLIRAEQQVEAAVWLEILSALSMFAGHWRKFEARTLERLHAKCLLIDEQLAYLGSANWYRYSLETSIELVLRGPLESVAGLLQEAEQLWEQASSLQIPAERGTARPSAADGITHEVLDPLAAKVLKDNPKAFIFGKKKQRNS